MPTKTDIEEGSWTTSSGVGALLSVLLILLGYFCWRQILHSLGHFGVRLAEEETGGLLEREMRLELLKRQIDESRAGEVVGSSRATDLIVRAATPSCDCLANTDSFIEATGRGLVVCRGVAGEEGVEGGVEAAGVGEEGGEGLVEGGGGLVDGVGAVGWGEGGAVGEGVGGAVVEEGGRAGEEEWVAGERGVCCVLCLGAGGGRHSLIHVL